MFEVGMYIKFLSSNKVHIRRIASSHHYGIRNNTSIVLDRPYRNNTYSIRADRILEASYTLLGTNEEDGLIQVGDYVNGYPVRAIFCINDKKGVLLDRLEKSPYDYENLVYEKDIQTVLTKEEFELLAYKVKGE